MLTSNKNLVVLTKIILIYSIFYVGIKLFIIMQGAWLIPNLILCVPYIVFVIVSGLIVKSQRYSWPFAVFALIVIVLVRIYETPLAQWVQEQLIAG